MNIFKSTKNWLVASVAVASILPINVMAETVSIDLNGAQFSLELPDGTCNLNDHKAGKMTLEFLHKQLSKVPNFPVPKVVFNQCANPDYNPYPWGYITVRPSSKGINSQLDLNKKAEIDASDSDMQAKLDKVIEQVKEITDPEASIKEHYGVDASDMVSGVPQLLEISEHAVHMLMTNEMTVNGTFFKETIYMSLMYVKGHTVFWYMNDNMESGFDPIAWIDDLNKAGALTER